jgi:hypothetical protein
MHFCVSKRKLDLLFYMYITYLVFDLPKKYIVIFTITRFTNLITYVVKNYF